MPRAQKGQRFGGREKGTPNKTTIEVKAALEYAFDEIGGKKKFADWAKENPSLFYQLWAKMLPKDIKGDVNVSHSYHELLERA